jgi:glycolate oxidase FAD binding subunit
MEAGITLNAVQEILAREHQFLPLDPPHPSRATVGGVLATNLNGPRRGSYGSTRDLAIGMKVALATGELIKAGGKVVKNVAGYDLGKLFCGSQGRFGLIARASLRLHPIPAAAGTLLALIGGADDAFRLTQLVHRSQLVPSAVDLLWTRGGTSRLALLFEGSERAVSSQLEAAGALLGGEKAGEETWQEARDWQSGAAGRISFPPGGLAETLRTLAEALVRPGVGAAYTVEPLHEEGDAGARRLAETVRSAFDPGGVLV